MHPFDRLRRATVGVLALSLLLAIGIHARAQDSSALNADRATAAAQSAKDLVAKMTLVEKVSQMQNHAAAIPRLGVPEYDWWSEALHGVARSGYATVFPQAIGMAATWDTALIREEGNVIGIEGRGKFNSAVRDNNHAIFFGIDFWSPNVNIFRDPRWGRGQETYGEDPFLTGQLAIQFIKGLQGNNPKYYLAIATPKHFSVHSGPEPKRHGFNVNVSPHDLADTYLPAFHAAIVDAQADSIMCAYNAVDGVPACANKMLLQKILRGQWRFNGYVVSDCGAIGDIANGHKYTPTIEKAAVAAVRAGTDLSCGNEYGTLVQAVHDGLIQQSEIDTAVQRLMTARYELGTLHAPGEEPFSSLDNSIVYSKQHAALDLRAAEESMVLLKNDGVLPLRAGTKTIAIVGPNASSLAALEGNYNGVSIDPQTPLAAFQAIGAQKNLRILDAQGSPYVEQLSLPVPPGVFRTAGGKGLRVQYFPNTDFTGRGVSATAVNIETNWNAASPFPQEIPAKAFSARWIGTITPPAPGSYQFQVKVDECYPCDNTETYAVWVDGHQVSSGTSHNGKNRASTFFTVQFADTKPHSFRLDYSHQSRLFAAGISFNWKPPVEVLRREAVQLAKQADVVIAVVGISPRLEGEEMPVHIPGFSGGDRTSIDLPDVQQQLLQSLAATGKPLVVVLMNGSGLAVDWAQQHANAILEAWYPGARGGTAIADTLLGASNPGGRLPVTFYASTSQLPPFEDYSMANRTYRYFRGTPLYGFGYGLSYSKFSFSHLTLSSSRLKAGDPLIATAKITNSSKIAGDEVAELYIGYPQADGAPLRSLAAFTRVHIQSGETKAIVFTLDPRKFSHVGSDGKRVISAGSYQVFIGGSQPSPTATGSGAGVSAPLTITGNQTLPD